MNILFLMGVYPSYGGVEKVSTILANEFVKKGYNVSIVSFEQPYPELAEKELNPSVKLYKLNYPVNTKENRNKLKQIVRNEKTDFIINQWCVPYYVTRLCRIAIKGTQCKLIAVHHNLPNTNARIQNIKIAIEQKQGNTLINKLKLFAITLISRLSLRYTYEKSNQYIVLSPSFIPIAQKYIWIKNTNKISSIYNPITIEAAQRKNIKQNEIIYVGRIEDNQKRTFRLLEIWEQLEPKFPSWHFTVVGDGPNRKDLEKGIEKLSLKNISIKGFQDPKSFYERAAILILTSEYEGLPLVVIESMNYGVIPVVLGSYTAAYDTIKSGISGSIIPYPYSRDTFVQELQELMDNQKLRAQMSQDAIMESHNFEREEIVKKWINLFNQLS